MPARYVIFEGISGCGKETQKKLLAEWLVKKSYDILTVVEPNDPRVKRTIRDFKRIGIDEPYVDAALFVFDRSYLIHKTVIPALKVGKTVLSVRGFPSSYAVQTSVEMPLDYLIAANGFVPVPDLIYVFDLPAEVAFSRVNEREVGTWDGEKGKWERDIQNLRLQRQRYLKLAELLENVEIIDANRKPEFVHDDVKKVWVRKFEF
jgi:dTMP kinase